MLAEYEKRNGVVTHTSEVEPFPTTPLRKLGTPRNIAVGAAMGDCGRPHGGGGHWP